MIAQQSVQDAIANNLANLNTVGFKQDIPTFRSLRDMAVSRYENGGGRQGAAGTSVGKMGTGVVFDEAYTDYSSGSLSRSDQPLDLALVGDGFFTVQTAQGERFTRAGNFHLEPSGKAADGTPVAYLTDDNGNRVLGKKGAINLGDAKKIEIDPKGTVLADGVAVDQLKIVTAPRTQIQKDGSNLFRIQGGTTESKASVRQGFLEQANVSPIGTMVRMIGVQRAYEAAQKAIVAQDETLGKVVNEVGHL